MASGGPGCWLDARGRLGLCNLTILGPAHRVGAAIWVCEKGVMSQQVPPGSPPSIVNKYPGGAASSNRGE